MDDRKKSKAVECLTITIEEVKKHLQMLGGEDEGEYLTLLLSSAIAVAEKEIHRKAEELTPSEFRVFRMSVLLLVAEWYKNREATTDLSVNTLPFGFVRLCDYLRRYTTDEGRGNNM